MREAEFGSRSLVRFRDRRLNCFVCADSTAASTKDANATQMFQITDANQTVGSLIKVGPARTVAHKIADSHLPDDGG
jgi:hypothetical protein